jgi:hypothetical protein
VDGLEIASVKFLNSLHERKMDPESQAAAGRAEPQAAPTPRGARA